MLKTNETLTMLYLNKGNVPSKTRQVRDNKILVTHPMTYQLCLASAIARTDRKAIELLDNCLKLLLNKWLDGV
jgi:endo-1,4-beta-D-glucanase Y